MEATRVEIFRDGLWRKLRLQDGKAIKYNALINRIGRIDSREISHTNTFSLLAIFQNTDALGINTFNKTELAKALNSKFPAKYYVEDKLLQQGFLVINNTSNGEINVNFIDEALEITDKWGSTTWKELIESETIAKPEDYRLAILEMTNYNMSKSSVLTPLSEVGTRGYNLALFPNSLNAIGDNFQQPLDGERLDNTFNPYQSRPIWNAKALFDLAVESYGYTPEYDSSINWSRVEKTYMVEEGLDQNKVEDEGQVKITYPSQLRGQYRETGRPGHGYKYYVPGYHSSVTNAYRPTDIPGWVHPPNGHYFGSRDWNLDYRLDKSLLKPEVASATFGELHLSANIYRARNIANYEHEFIGYSCWENSTPGGNVLFNPLTFSEQIFAADGSRVDFTIQKSQLANIPYGSNGNLHGVIFSMKKRHRYREQFFTSEYLYNINISETYLLADVISYDDQGQYIANSINLQHSAPNKTIKELMSGIMQKEGILLSINSKTKTVKFFSYSLYRKKRDNGDFQDWSDYWQEYVSPLFNTDYGDAYAKKNEISLTDPYLGNTYDFFLENQGSDSKYKEFVQSPVAIYKDVEDIKRINNSLAPYYEYKNTGLGLVEKTDTIGSLTQVSSDGIEQGIIPALQLVANVNYAELPSGVQEWYNLVNRAIRGNSTFLLPVDVVRDLDLSQPIYIEGLGGFFIIEEIEEYVDATEPVVVKLIKLIESADSSETPTSGIQFVGTYNGSSTYTASLSRLTRNVELVGSYSGSSTYGEADFYYDFLYKDLIGSYTGSSTYIATLNTTITIKELEGSYSEGSTYSAKLIIEPKKFLLRTTDTFIGVLDIEGEVKVTEKITTPEIDFNTDTPGGRVTWNDFDHTLDIETGLGTTIQVGQETLVHVHNANAFTIEDGSAVYPIGSSTNGLPNIGLCIANSHETIVNQVGLVTGNILPGEDGFVTLIGTVRNIDTSDLSLGPVYISTTIPGKLTSVKPIFPDYAILMGNVLSVGATTGSIITDIRDNVYETFNNFWNGTIRESFQIPVTSDGTTITATISDIGARGRLTLIFSDGLTTFNNPVSINLPPGTATIPILYYIYIPKSTKALTYSTTGFPVNEEHIKIATAYIQNAASVQFHGPLNIRYWNDEIEDNNTRQGHLSHIVERIRQEDARYSSGIDFINTVTPTSNLLSLTSGVVYQMHRTNISAFNMATGSHIHVANHFTTKFLINTNMATLANNALGVSTANSSFSFVVWGVVNSGSIPTKIMVNLPIGGYPKNAPATAVSDPSNYSVYTIPNEFNGLAYLIARFTYVREANGDWSLYHQEDLRGRNISAGGGSAGSGSGGVTTFAALTDTPSGYATFANWLVRVAPSEAGLEFIEPKTNLFLNNGSDGVNPYLDTTRIGVTIQPYSTQVAFKNIDNNFSVAQTAPNFFSNNLATQNNHLVRLDQLNSAISGIRWSDSVDSFYNNTTSLPVAPGNGDRYIAEVTANGWTANNIYEWMTSPNQWVEFPADAGMTVTVYSLDTNFTFNGTNWVEFGTTISHNNLTGLQGGIVAEYYHLTAAQHSNLTSIDTANIAYKNQANTFTQNQTITGRLDVSSSISIGDDLSVASLANEKRLRYRTTANGSYIDMCMQTGVATYAWINIVKNEW